MAETLLQYQKLVLGPDDTAYEARACGSPMSGGTWQGWIEFVPIPGGAPVRTAVETTQPNRVDTEYWATGISAIYLEGALRRALSKPTERTMLPTQPAIFSEPAPSLAVPVEARTSAVLDPFSVYEKGEPLLRRQLSSLAAWHLVNIILTFDLSDLDAAALNRLPAPALISMIVTGVRENRKLAPRHKA